MILCYIEDDELSAQAVGFARTLGDVRAVTFAGTYQPAGWAKTLAAQDADAIVAAGSDRGNELLAHVGAILDHPFAANVIALDGDTVTRVRWGGSLLEEARLHGAPKLLTVAPHTQAAAEIGEVETLDAPDDGSPKVLERVEESSGGVSLRDAKVVVSGGRGVGSAEGRMPTRLGRRGRRSPPTCTSRAGSAARRSTSRVRRARRRSSPSTPIRRRRSSRAPTTR